MFAFVNASPVLSGFVYGSLSLMRNGLVLIGLVAVLFATAFYAGVPVVGEQLRNLLPSAMAVREALASDDEVLPQGSETLSPRMQAALQYVSRRYRVSMDALQPVFVSAEETAREVGLDPLLIIAVIGVESGFNPFSQSVFGAQGLMQVVPRFHQDKLPENVGELPFIDPVTNVQVGARVLKESIQRFGGLMSGLQQFGGALDDPERRYSTKVLAELQRLKTAARGARASLSAASAQSGKAG